VRIEIGPRDLAEGNVTLVVRHRREKRSVPLGGVGTEVGAALTAAGRDLLAEATAFREARTANAATLEETIEAGSVGFARVRLGALGPDGEDRLAQHALTVRLLQRPDGSLAEEADADEDLFALVGRSY
jgi:prolyl-tRNA synthetase